MSDIRLIIAIDQGTTSSRAILFDEAGTALAHKSIEFQQHFPADGWVEHDPETIWQTTVDVTSAMVAEARSRGNLPIAIGITNQRETAIIWDRATGKAIHNAIVWQDRRTADICTVMKNAGKETMVREKTGLLIDPYFTATKLSWILRRGGWRARPRRRGRTVFRHCRQLPDLAADRRPDTCYRRDQRQPYQPLQHSSE